MYYCVSHGATVTQHAGKQEVRVLEMRKEEGAHTELVCVRGGAHEV